MSEAQGPSSKPSFPNEDLNATIRQTLLQLKTHWASGQHTSLTPTQFEALLSATESLLKIDPTQALGPNYPIVMKIHQTLTSIAPHVPPLSKEDQKKIGHLIDQLSPWPLTYTKEPQALELFLVFSDQHLAEELEAQFTFFRYTCTWIKSISELMDKLVHRPRAILIEVGLCCPEDQDKLNGISAHTPLIFLSKDQSIDARLFAVRAGGQAFYSPPVEFTSLVEKIDECTTLTHESTPYRILIVEDSKTQAAYTQKTLEGAGMMTTIVSKPLTLLEILKEFQPELILMDLYMPDCSGIELAHVIRQQENYVSIPIVFLSAETDTAKKLDAMLLGSDDFLSKSISSDHLISSVTARAKRSRALRAEMIQDGLTGLLNHTRILEQLDLEIARAQRSQEQVSFAMIDIDHFKSINDTYGHPIGDRVIKSLARLLKQRLRKSDSIGRYGGEEFAIILPFANAQSAQVILNDIRESFAKMGFQGQLTSQHFSVTFSAGISALTSQHSTVDSLVQSADMALYRAKSQGRNQVVLDTELTASSTQDR